MSKAVTVGSLAAGVLIGAGTIYAYRSGLQVSDVLAKIEENSEKFEVCIRNLIEYGREFLEKVYNLIKTFVMDILFRLKIIESRAV